MKTIDIIAAVRNEEQSIPRFIEEIHGLRIPDGVTLGIIFVEDSSTDRTVEVLRETARKHPDVRYYSLRKGFGEGPAVVFGLTRSRADAVIMMNGDGGHPPEEIPGMIRRYLDGADIVQCVRLDLIEREWFRSAGTSAFNLFTRLATGFDMREQNVYFRLVSAKYRDLIVRNRRWIHFLRIVLPKGAECRVDTIHVGAADRWHGTSTYGFTRLLRLSLLAMLSVIAPARLAFVLVALALAGAAATLVGYPYLGLPLLLVAAWIAWSYRRLAHNTILDSIEVKERSE